MAFMGIDIGSSGCKSAVFDSAGKMLSHAYRSYEARRAGKSVELPSDTVFACVDQVISEAASASPEPVEALACSGIGEAFVPFDAQGSPCGNSIMGADRRGDEALTLFLDRFGRDRLRDITGNPPGPGYALGTLLTLPGDYRNARKMLPWSDAVAAKLSGVPRFNRALASRTMLYDRKQRRWSEEIPEAGELAARYFADFADAGEILGEILPAQASQLHLPKHCKIVCGTHDQCAAAFGSGVLNAHTPMLGLGTYACMVTLLPSGDDGNAWTKKINHEEYILPGTEVGFLYHGSCGALVEWVRKTFFPDLKTGNVYEQMFSALRLSESLPVVIADFAESGPPEHGTGGRGMIGELSLEHTREEIFAAVLLGILFYFRNAVQTLPSPEKVFINGGLTRSDLFSHLVADVLNLPAVLTSEESGLLGSAMLAAWGARAFSSPDDAVKNMANAHRHFEPDGERQKLIDKVFARYQQQKKALACI
ncbi:MAG: FGGY family carbohydrate kinase [Victivallaceae bacterium]|nr:FGGY family carbohydrate kinase [Victivallaceae bacterium]